MTRCLAVFAAIVLCTTAPGLAQTLEPHLPLAVRAVVSELVAVLPAREPRPEALRVLPRGGPDAEVVRRLRSALAEEGFRLVDERHTDDRVLELQVWTEPLPPHRRLVLETVEASPFRSTSAYGDAPWVTEPAAGRIVVEGPWAPNGALALEGARKRAVATILAEAGWVGPSAKAPPVKLEIARSFVGTSGAEGEGSHRAWIEVAAAERAVETARSTVERALRRQALAPWIRGGAIVVLLAGLGLAYLLTDLRTRGYFTGRLRMLFATLFLIGTGLCWRVLP